MNITLTRSLQRIALAGVVSLFAATASFSVSAQSALESLLQPGDEPELLAPEQAFTVETRMLDERTAEVRWTIASDYYMYRDRYRVTADTTAVTVGALEIPPGKIKSDPAFGEVETFTEGVAIKVPLSGGADGSQRQIDLKVTGQGCNEPVGVCYPPITHEITLDLDNALASTDGGYTPKLEPTESGPLVQMSSDTLPQSSPTGAASTPIDSLSSLSNMLGGDQQQEFLDPDDAFKLNLMVNDPQSLLADFVVADGYYIYENQIKFEAVGSDVRLEAPRFPDGKEKEDEFFGKVTVFYKQMTAPVGIVRTPGDARDLEVKATYQGCAEDGICYPPITKTLSLKLPALIASADAASTSKTQSIVTPSAGAASAATASTAAAAAGGDGDASRFAGKSLWGILITAFGIGILLTFTPCVLPLIPILTSVIAGQGDNVTRTRGGLLAIIYVLGTAVTYAAIGWVAGATGEQLQAYFQNAWAVGFLVAVFVVMALAMFGLFEVQMPGFLQSKLQGSTQNIKGGAMGGVFVLGLVSALIVGACVSPLLISVLSLAIARGDALLGALMMFAMALGMGVFLVLIGFGAGALIPKAGPWMDRVTQGFGVMLLGVAIYMLNIFPEVPVLLLWAALFIVTAIFLGATQALPEGASGWRYLWKGVGTVMLVWGVVAMLGGFAGNRDILNPLPILANQVSGGGSGVAVKSHDELFKRVNNDAELNAAMADAKSRGRMVLLDYYADWCVDCKRMEATTLVDDKVTPLLDARFDMLQIDVTDPNDADSSGLKKRFGVFGPPAMLFFDTNGNEIKAGRLYGYRDADTFAEILRGI